MKPILITVFAIWILTRSLPGFDMWGPTLGREDMQKCQIVARFFPVMIVSQFSILEIDDSGEENFLCSFKVREKVSSLVRVFEHVTSGLVALCIKRSADLVCVVVCLLEKRVPFVFVQSEDEAISSNARWFFDGKQLAEFSRSHVSIDDASNDLCYVIKTSGSTGKPKLVGVPYSCIEPNIEDFRERLSISHEDIILGSTSFLFDPSIVEMFLSFVSGALLLLVPDNFRSQPHLLSGILRKYTPSIVQLTPSVLSILDDSTLAWMLGELSPIRCLLVGGSRRCFIDGVLAGEFTSTGDIAEMKGSEYFIVGRLDDQVKVNGTRCNLAFLSEQVASLDGIVFAQFLLCREKFLVLFVKSASPVERCLKEVLPLAHFPAKIIYLDHVPVNSNGKTDRSRLIAILEEERFNHLKSLSSVLRFLAKFGIKSATGLSLHSFIDYDSQKENMLWLLRTPDSSCAFVSVMAFVCGSHFSCRFEASLERCNDCIVAGGLDGCVYFLSVFSGRVEWKFPTNDIIKAPCVCVDPGFVYVTSYEKTLYKLNTKLKSICWSCKILSGSPARAVLWNEFVLVTTIKGSVEAIDSSNGKHCWSFMVGSPIFSSITALCHIGYITAVDGTITKIRLDSGDKEGSVAVKEPMFASVVVFDGLVYAATQRGSLFIVDENLCILR
ncbi:unnamed protein product [Haemonchus placei]|uniref:AMP-binding domain-containing protein n=1 Tax=Haemonchus placei TaxID=6290 RepID=A0A0N4W6Z2_HAEPC|nr:unnamed protein product [Haemonchus placei]